MAVSVKKAKIHNPKHEIPNKILHKTKSKPTTSTDVSLREKKKQIWLFIPNAFCYFFSSYKILEHSVKFFFILLDLDGGR